MDVFQMTVERKTHTLAFQLQLHEKKSFLSFSLSSFFKNSGISQSAKPDKNFTGHKEPILGIAQSPDGKYILSGSDDNLAFLWNENGVIIDTIAVHEKSVNDVAFAPDNSRFITAGGEGSFVIWNINGTKIKNGSGR
jgi:WD40 repeat protein